MDIKKDEDWYSINEDDDEIIQPFNIEDKIIDKMNDTTYLIKLNAREIINTANWCYNRELNIERVNELYENFLIKDKNYITPLWNFQMIYDSKNDDNKLFLIDGQHRKTVLKKYLKEYDDNMTFNEMYYCTVYNIDLCETLNKKISIDLFKKINNNRQFREEELPDDFIAELVEALSHDDIFKFGIKINPKTETAQEPNIHKKELNILFNQYKEKIKNMTIEEIILNMKKINNRLSLKDYKDLFGNKGKRKIELHEKAKKNKLFLNLKSSLYPSNEWIKYIDKPNEL